jgi:hypothetical protein
VHPHLLSPADEDALYAAMDWLVERQEANVQVDALRLMGMPLRASFSGMYAMG